MEGNMLRLVTESQGYAFYRSDGSAPLYNIVPIGSPPPEGGYRNKEYIERIKHVCFPKEKQTLND